MPARALARLALLALAGAPVLLGAGGCGGRESDETKVRATLADFGQAIARRDYQRICDDLFSEALVSEVEKSLPCEVALRRSELESLREPKLEVRSVRVRGRQASAQIRSTATGQPPSQDTVQLVREGTGWRIASLAS